MMSTTTQNGTNGHTVPAPTTSLALPTHTGAINAFGSESAFEVSQRMAKALAASTMVPEQYRGNVANCMIAIELASRIGCSVFMVMQHLYIVKGKPSWSAVFLISTVNSCGRFTPIRFTFVGEKGKPGWGCYAHATDKDSGEECVGTTITLEMAKAEGWGSKWQTMPEQMMRYRAATFWTRAYAPEAGMGMATQEELEDMPSPPRRIDVVAEVIPDAPGSAPAVDEVATLLSRIRDAKTLGDLKAVSRDAAKRPADIGAAIQAEYLARKAELSKPQPVAHDPGTGELDPSGYSVNEAQYEAEASAND